MPAEVTDAAEDRARHAWVLAFVVVATTLPILTAGVVMAARGWVPVGEFAQAELRVRDFWSHPPSLGAVGRLRTETHVSSHPGPAAWWAMWPVYAAAGRSAGALSLAVAVAAAGWVSAALVLLWRRAGDVGALIGGVAVTLLVVSLGPIPFVEPWNPWFAVMPFLCAAVAAWSTACGHPWSAAVLVAGGSYAVQAHVGYAPLVAALVVVAALGLVVQVGRERVPTRALVVPVGVAVAVGAAMWVLPALEQLRGDPGNVTVLLDAYERQARLEPYLGPGGALELVGAHLAFPPRSLVDDDVLPTDRTVGVAGVVLMLTWVATAALSWRRRRDDAFDDALWLHAVAATMVLAAVVAASRVVGDVYGYLVLWLGVVAVMLSIAVAWTAWLALRHHEAVRRYTPIVVAATLLGAAGTATVRFADPPTPAEQLEALTAELVEQVAPRVPQGRSYVVRWDDPLAFGAVGTGVLSELERRGVDVGVDPRLGAEMRPHRVLDGDEADAALWVVTGAGIERWRATDGVQELAVVDARTSAERRADEAEADAVRDELRRVGGDELADQLDANYWVARSDPRVPEALGERIDALAANGLPTAVFLTDPATPQA